MSCLHPHKFLKICRYFLLLSSLFSLPEREMKSWHCYRQDADYVSDEWGAIFFCNVQWLWFPRTIRAEGKLLWYWRKIATVIDYPRQWSLRCHKVFITVASHEVLKEKERHTRTWPNCLLTPAYASGRHDESFDQRQETPVNTQWHIEKEDMK